MKPISLVASVLLGIVAIAHVLRLAFRTEVVIGGRVLPMWVSGAGAVAAGALAVLLFRDASAKR